MSFLKKFKRIFHITLWETIIALAVIATYFILARAVFAGHPPLWLTISGFVVGTWLAFRPSEWAVTGLDSGAKYVGLSDYVAGVLSSLASNLPEAVIAIFLIINQQQLIAVITVLSAAGFNTLILGIAIVISTIKKKGKIKVPEELEKREAPIIRWGIVALTMTVVFGLVQYAVLGKDNLLDAILTVPVAAMLGASYLIYLVYLIAVRGNNSKMSESIHKLDEEEESSLKNEEIAKEEEREVAHKHEKLSIPFTILLLVLGFVGIFFAGEVLTESVEHLIDYTTNAGNDFFTSAKGEITLALILGAAGAVPEHSIAVLSSLKGEVEVGIGNAMGGILQSSLLIFGILGVITNIRLDPFIIIQLASIAGTLWFVKRCIHDRKFDLFEGVMIIILQILVFVILFEDIAILV
jgi:Ca2+/Na+ antiporter